jgi:hypothetical protein
MCDPVRPARTIDDVVGWLAATSPYSPGDEIRFDPVNPDRLQTVWSS